MIIKKEQLELIKALGDLNFTNPFLEERVELERKILGEDFSYAGTVWHIHEDQQHAEKNLRRIIELTAFHAEDLRNKISLSEKLTKEIVVAYENLIVYHLFEKYRLNFTRQLEIKYNQCGFTFFEDFSSDYNYYMNIISKHKNYLQYDLKRTFEIFFQVHRAFHYIFRSIIGSSLAIAKLRADIWQSVFSCDIYRYNRSLYDRMNNISTLITGPSGTGKELIARAIALSQYLPFDDKKLCFIEDYHEKFHPLHLSAMPATLIESELFGHLKGAFSGAVVDRIGRMEYCSRYGTVFLDEIGEINHEIQVKLLRLLQDRTFCRIGDNEQRSFTGKILTATNRNLLQEVDEGNFRQDLYYRLCSDIIATPDLQQVINGSEKELYNIVNFISKRVATDSEAEWLSSDTIKAIKKGVGLDYNWPGNFRELEQCVRNVLIRGDYSPQYTKKITSKMPKITNKELIKNIESIENGDLSADEILNLYCHISYSKTNNYVKSAQILQLDRRTITKRVQNYLQDNNLK
ncbi:sigma-54 factor interaction domain-containing protein [Lentisphaerota bacterium WC36G]|nr:sigma-54 factor interaction domain-containing protein [Lentisphaerae bacterium WC36]